MMDLFHIKKDCKNCTFHSDNMTKAEVKEDCCVYKLHHKIHPPEGEEIIWDPKDLSLCDNYILSLDHLPTMYYLKDQDDLRNLYNKCAAFFEGTLSKYDSNDFFYPALAIINWNTMEEGHTNKAIKVIPMMDIVNYESEKS